jgi:hypothetical protein
VKEQVRHRESKKRGACAGRTVGAEKDSAIAGWTQSYSYFVDCSRTDGRLIRIVYSRARLVSGP